MDPIQFVINESNTYYKLEPGKSLLEFTEFDFTFFWEQCIDAGKTAYKTGRLPAEAVRTAKNSLMKCHPYVEASINGEFDGIVTDCIIAYICNSEHIGLEELWARCISPKNNYETAIFRRISEYKTGRSINQWINIVRINEYARKKLDFIYDEKKGTETPADMYRRRKDYFDLAFSIAANDLGYPANEMPYVRRYSASLAPAASFRMGKLSHFIYHTISEDLKNASHSYSKHVESYTADQAAMDAFSYLKDLKRPETADMNRMTIGTDITDTVIYMPTGFKSVIDLEFDLLAENGECIRRCASCGRYFLFDKEYGRPFCSRVNSSGKTCRSTDEEQQRIKKEAEEKLEAARKEADEKLKKEKQAFLEQKKPKVPVIIPRDLENKSLRVYGKLSGLASNGKMDKYEFEEWVYYLENLKHNISEGDGSLVQLEDFLNSAEKMYEDIENGKADRTPEPPKKPKSRSRKKAPERPAPPEDDEAPIITANYGIRKKQKNSDNIIKYEPVSFDDMDEQPEEVHYTEDGRKYTAFVPKKYSSPEEAALDMELPDDDNINGGVSEDTNDTYEEYADAVSYTPKTDKHSRYGNIKARKMSSEDEDYTPPPPKTPEVHYTDDGRKYTAFAPKKYSSLYEAMNDNSYNSETASGSLGDIMNAAELAALQKPSDDDFSSEIYSSDGSRKSLPTRVIRKPDWEILSADNRKRF